jgi:hypothetical protein
MTVPSFFRKYSVGCILNYVRLIITREISCIYSYIQLLLQLCTEVSQVKTQRTIRTRNLGQHFFDISKKNDVNQSLVSLINDNY